MRNIFCTYIIRIIMVCMVLTLYGQDAIRAADLNKHTLMSGTPYATEALILAAVTPGPAAIVLGGVHGNEPAGAAAAQKISKLSISRGVLIIIPRVNEQALRHRLRTLPEIGDINRAYPGTRNGMPAEQIAYEIISLMHRYQVTMLIDLHEARTFHRLDKTSVGQSILFAANTKSTGLALDALEHVNGTIAEPYKKFSLIAHPVPGSAAHFAGEKLGIAAFTVETSRKQPLADRVNQHVTVTTFLLKAEGLL